jgi:hypothetical protein
VESTASHMPPEKLRSSDGVQLRKAAVKSLILSFLQYTARELEEFGKFLHIKSILKETKIL